MHRHQIEAISSVVGQNFQSPGKLPYIRVPLTFKLVRPSLNFSQSNLLALCSKSSPSGVMPRRMPSCKKLWRSIVPILRLSFRSGCGRALRGKGFCTRLPSSTSDFIKFNSLPSLSRVMESSLVVVLEMGKAVARIRSKLAGRIPVCSHFLKSRLPGDG